MKRGTQISSLALAAAAALALLAAPGVVFVQEPAGEPAGASTPAGAAATGAQDVDDESLRKLVDKTGRSWKRLSSEDKERLRKRWQGLPAKERRQVLERFKRYQGMSEVERGELNERQRNIREVKRRVLKRLTPEQKAVLQRLEPERRARLMNELVGDELRRRGRSMEARMPRDWQRRLEGAGPEERLRFFHDFKRSTRELQSPVAVERLGGMLGLSEERVAALKALPPEERASQVLDMRKQLAIKGVEASGLPPGMKREDWKRLQDLPPAEFFAEAMRLEESRDWTPHGAPPWRVERRQRAGPGERREPGERRVRGGHGKLRKVLHAGRITPEERLELAHLTPEERDQALSKRRRERMEAELERSGLYSPEELEAARKLTDREFHHRLRQHMRAEPQGSPAGKGGPAGREGRRRGPQRPGEPGSDHRGGRRGPRGAGPPPPPPDEGPPSPPVERPGS